jgi:hypothetical protein
MDVKSLRSFLGHAGFYRRFIKDFSKITKPLTHLLQKDVPFDFDKKCLAAFRTLKSVLVSAPIIQPPDWSQPFEIMCDASDYAVGAVLGQRKEGRVHAVYYASKTLNEAQLNYANGKGVASGGIHLRKIQILHRELEGHCLHQSRSHQVSLG